jgi:hypothetical protein
MLRVQDNGEAGRARETGSSPGTRRFEWARWTVENWCSKDNEKCLQVRSVRQSRPLARRGGSERALLRAPLIFAATEGKCCPGSLFQRYLRAITAKAVVQNINAVKKRTVGDADGTLIGVVIRPRQTCASQRLPSAQSRSL